MGGVADLLRGVAAGSPPAGDFSTELHPQPDGPSAGVLGFAAHHVIAADVDAEWLDSMLPADDFVAPLSARFLAALGDRLDREPGCLDVMLVAPQSTSVADLDLVGGLDITHPRAVRAQGYRTDLSVYTVDGGMVLVGRGFAGRWEVALEVDPVARGRGLGRRLASAAASLVPAGESLWAQVSPGNVASLRAFLAAGYAPVGSEVLFVDGRAD